MALSYAQLEQLWISAGGNPQAASVAAAIAIAEDGGNSTVSAPNANGSRDVGYWQINTSHGAQATLDPMGNARAAIAISANGTNWRPWCTAWTNGCSGTYAPTAPNTPSGRAFASGGVGGSVPSAGGALPAGVATGPVANPLSPAFYSHIIDVLGNWSFYLGLIAAGAVIGVVGFAILFRETPAGVATAGAVRRAATVIPFM